jgi:hypothetical protein
MLLSLRPEWMEFLGSRIRSSSYDPNTFTPEALFSCKRNSRRDKRRFHGTMGEIAYAFASWDLPANSIKCPEPVMSFYNYRVAALTSGNP